MKQALKLINISTFQVIVSIIFIIFLVKIHLVILKLESELNYEKHRTISLNNHLTTIEFACKQNKGIIHLDSIQNRDRAKPKETVRKSVAIHNIASSLFNTQKDSTKQQNTQNRTLGFTVPPKVDSIKRTYNFYGNYSDSIRINKMFSINKVVLTLVLNSYDSLYQYTKYLGITNYKLSFIQRRIGRESDVISNFRIARGRVENNQGVSCQFVEVVPDLSSDAIARVVNFTGTISNSEITGILSWIDRSDGARLPVKIPLTLKIGL